MNPTQYITNELDELYQTVSGDEPVTLLHQVVDPAYAPITRIAAAMALTDWLICEAEVFTDQQLVEYTHCLEIAQEGAMTQKQQRVVTELIAGFEAEVEAREEAHTCPMCGCDSRHGEHGLQALTRYEYGQDWYCQAGA